MIVAAETALRPATLDELATRTTAELEALYRQGTVPSLEALDGTPKGRMLTVRRLERGAVGRAIARFAASARFVWDGKSFVSTSATAGSGINRVHLPGVLGDQDLFPFDTRVEPSAIDGAPAIVLDYDLPANPPWIRRVHDEVREVSPGLFLGPAMWKRGAGKTTVLWFALDAKQQA